MMGRCLAQLDRNGGVIHLGNVEEVKVFDILGAEVI